MKFTKEDINSYFITLIEDEQKVPASEVDVHAEFYTFGLDSISSIYLLDKLEDYLGIKLNPIDFFDYPTIDKFSSYLIDQKL